MDLIYTYGGTGNLSAYVKWSWNLKRHTLSLTSQNLSLSVKMLSPLLTLNWWEPIYTAKHSKSVREIWHFSNGITGTTDQSPNLNNSKDRLVRLEDPIRLLQRSNDFISYGSRLCFLLFWRVVPLQVRLAISFALAPSLSFILRAAFPAVGAEEARVPQASAWSEFETRDCCFGRLHYGSEREGSRKGERRLEIVRRCGGGEERRHAAGERVKATTARHWWVSVILSDSSGVGFEGLAAALASIIFRIAALPPILWSFLSHCNAWNPEKHFSPYTAILMLFKSLVSYLDKRG